MFTKAMSSAEKIRQKAASCLHESSILLDFFHRAKAREREGAKRIRACTADPKQKAASSVPISSYPPDFFQRAKPVSEKERSGFERALRT